MALHANRTSFLLLGLIFMISKYSVAVAHSLKRSDEVEDYPHLKPEQDAFQTRKIDYNATYDIPPTENKENDSPVLQKRDLPINTGIIAQSMHINDGRIDINNMGGFTIRAWNPESKPNVMVHNDALYVEGEDVCQNINEKLNKLTFQKTADGTYWYTNINVGEPMTQAEIDNFKTEWAQYEKERQEKRKQRGADRKPSQKEREEQRKAERRQREEDRERQRKQQEEEWEKLRQEREAERRQRESKKKELPVHQRTINTGIIAQSMHINDGRINIGNFGGFSIRAWNPENQPKVMVHNDVLYVEGEDVCQNINEKLDKVAYQKTADGTYWYTNISVGEPMTQAEIDEFETKWAQYEKERQAKRKQRRAN